jgi:hypothetical protein
MHPCDSRVIVLGPLILLCCVSSAGCIRGQPPSALGDQTVVDAGGAPGTRDALPGGRDASIAVERDGDAAVADDLGQDQRARDSQAPDARAPIGCEEGGCPAGLDCLGNVCVCVEGGSCLGCCAGPRRCITSPTNAQCGIGGEACFSCAPGQDCAAGTCRCLAGQSCLGCCDGDTCVAPSNDQCGLDGARCFSCPDDLDCVDGRCGCVASGRCKGCCDGDQCLAGDTITQCGRLGEPCAPCDTGVADQCRSGTCACGDTGSSGSGTCQAGLVCRAAKCRCVPASEGGTCEGCCDGDTCVDRPTAERCGTQGDPCRSCPAGRADRCEREGAGVCSCGYFGLCEPDEVCKLDENAGIMFCGSPG